MIRINFIPQPKGYFKKLFLISLLFLLIIFITYLFLNHLNKRIEIQLGENLNYLPEDVYEKIDQEYWQSKYQEMEFELVKLDQIIDILEGGFYNPVFSLGMVTFSMPEQIYLTKITHENKGKYLFEGESINYNKILDWIKNLKEIPEVIDIQLLDVQADQYVHFTLQCETGGERK